MSSDSISLHYNVSLECVCFGIMFCEIWFKHCQRGWKWPNACKLFSPFIISEPTGCYKKQAFLEKEKSGLESWWCTATWKLALNFKCDF